MKAKIKRRNWVRRSAFAEETRKGKREELEGVSQAVSMVEKSGVAFLDLRHFT